MMDRGRQTHEMRGFTPTAPNQLWVTAAISLPPPTAAVRSGGDLSVQQPDLVVQMQDTLARVIQFALFPGLDVAARTPSAVAAIRWLRTRRACIDDRVTTSGPPTGWARQPPLEEAEALF